MKVLELQSESLDYPPKNYFILDFVFFVYENILHFWSDLSPFRKVLVLQGIFVGTGIFSTLGNQLVYYQGAAENDTLLPAAATFLGMCLAFFIPKEELKEENTGTIPWSKILLMGVLECLGCIFSLIGLNFAGSGIYQVIYASIVIWIALMSKYFLNKHLSAQQWIAVIVTTIGVSLSAFGSINLESKSINGFQILGIVITLLSTFAYGSNYIVSEQILSIPSHPSLNQVQTYTGFVSLLIILCYILFYTIPNWETVVSVHVSDSKGNLVIILIVYCFLALSAFLHSWSYYKLLKHMGSVSTGILQSLRAVCVFFLSSLLYCDSHPEQCITKTKIFSAFIVVGGVLYFTHLKKLEYNSSLKYKKMETLIIV